MAKKPKIVKHAFNFSSEFIIKGLIEQGEVNTENGTRVELLSVRLCRPADPYVRVTWQIDIPPKAKSPIWVSYENGNNTAGAEGNPTHFSCSNCFFAYLTPVMRFCPYCGSTLKWDLDTNEG